MIIYLKMKKAILASILIVAMAGCKETEFSPEGPTDVRIKNNSTLAMTEVTVNTSGGIKAMGSVNAGQYSEYFRFDKAFPKAEISAVINGQTYSTGTVDYNGMTYIGQAKITYVVYIKDANNKLLAISEVIPDAPLD